MAHCNSAQEQDVVDCWQYPMRTDPAGQYLILAQGPYTAAPAVAALPDVDVFPLLGPMGGGTTVMLQVCTTCTSLQMFGAVCQCRSPVITGHCQDWLCLCTARPLFQAAQH